MSNLKSLIRQLAKHALSKKGAEQSPLYDPFRVLENPHVVVAGAPHDEFFTVTGEGRERFAHLPAFQHVLRRRREQFPSVRESRRVERDGHVYMEVLLNLDVPVDALKSFIDEAYEIIWNKLDAHARLMVELAGLPYDGPKLIDRLIVMHDLKQHRKAIRNLARPAVLLRTRKSAESKIPVGATKIGGRPDLPADVDWPTYSDGKPLAFLAQLDLAEIAKAGTPIKGLPRDGLLSVFSAWGWMEEGDGDPQTPDYVYANAMYEWTSRVEKGAPPARGEGWDEQIRYTAILHTPPGAKLERRKTPRNVNSFKAAAVEPTPTLSLPRDRGEPPLAAQGWTDEEYERFDRMQSDYHSLQMKHWLGTSDAGASHHLLGGYALFQQEYPDELAGTGRAMFLQIGSDGNTHMCWGDGGELTFYADAKATAKGRFERVYCVYQCG